MLASARTSTASRPRTSPSRSRATLIAARLEPPTNYRVDMCSRATRRDRRGTRRARPRPRRLDAGGARHARAKPARRSTPPRCASSTRSASRAGGRHRRRRMCIPGYWLAGFYTPAAPRSLQVPLGWGTLGYAFPAALGAALAGRGPVVSMSGDGGFLFACGELATMAQEQIPLTAVIVDDGGYGMLRYDQVTRGESPTASTCRRPTRGDGRDLRRARGDRRRPRRRVRRSARPPRRRPGAIRARRPHPGTSRRRLTPPRTGTPGRSALSGELRWVGKEGVRRRAAPQAHRLPTSAQFRPGTAYHSAGGALSHP